MRATSAKERNRNRDYGAKNSRMREGERTGVDNRLFLRELLDDRDIHPP